MSMTIPTASALKMIGIPRMVGCVTHAWYARAIAGSTTPPAASTAAAACAADRTSTASHAGICNPIPSHSW